MVNVGEYTIHGWYGKWYINRCFFSVRQTSEIYRWFLQYIWMFPKIGMGPPNHPILNRFFHYFHHPFWGIPIFWKHPYLPTWMVDFCGKWCKCTCGIAAKWCCFLGFEKIPFQKRSKHHQQKHIQTPCYFILIILMEKTLAYCQYFSLQDHSTLSQIPGDSSRDLFIPDRWRSPTTIEGVT